MQRKIRRETMSGEQRLDKFLQQNGLILTAFSGGIVISQIASRNKFSKYKSSQPLLKCN